MQMTITLIPGFGSLTARMCLVLLLALGLGPRMAAEQCANATEMDAASRSAIERAALQLFDGLSKNNAAAVQQNSIASLAANFAGLQNAMAQSQPVLTGAPATVRTTYLLDTGGSGTIEHAEFRCGTWGTPHFVRSAIPHLPAGEGETHNLQVMFPVGAGSGMDLVVKYSSADRSATAQVLQDHVAVLSAVLPQFPDFRDSFQGEVEAAVDPAGHDDGTLLAMKD